jgi:hypothetical protein
VRSYLAGILSALLIAGTVLFLMTLSLKFDFGKCASPSREHPFFSSGRLLYGSLIPVLALYVCGVVAVTGRARLATAVVLGMSVAMMTLPQVVLWGQVLKSQYNWFHIVMHRPNPPVASRPAPAFPDGDRVLVGAPVSGTVPSGGKSAVAMPRAIQTRGEYHGIELLHPSIRSGLSCHTEVR